MPRQPIDVAKLKSVASGSKNPHLQTVTKELEEYNKLVPQKTVGPGRLIEHLDNAMVAASHWLTAKPPTGSDKNDARWDALLDLASAMSVEFGNLGVKPLRGDFKNAKQENYWLERIDPKHRPGYGTAPFYAKWKDHDEAITFWDYLDQQAPSLQGDVKFAYEMFKDSKEYGYYGADETKDLVMAIERLNGLTKNVKILEENARAEYLVKPGSGHLVEANGEVYCTKTRSTFFSGKGWAIFVVDAKNAMYSFSHSKGEFHHSSFLGGAPVKTAGELVVEDSGKVVAMTPKSGHYRPDLDSLKPFVKHLQLSQVLAPTAIVRTYWEPGQPSLFAPANDFITKGDAAPPLKSADVLKSLPKWAHSDQFRKLLGGA
jgi:hypothetical protein